MRRFLSAAIACFSVSLPLFGINQLSVERRTLRYGESVMITVSLEHDFADLEDIRIPVHNLTISDPPSIATDSALINFTVVKRKILRFRARPTAPGMAMVGPVVLAIGSQRDTLPAIAIEILPDRAASSNDPRVILSELLATGRQPIFVVAEQETNSAHVGEQVIVTWYLYNASTVQQWQIGSIPKLDEFWIEELDVRSARPVTVLIGDYTIQKMPVRRVALYPLRPGRLEIGPLEIEAAVLRRSRMGPFSMFEGNLVEVAFASAPVWINAQPLPPGPPVSAIGELAMRCLPAQQRNGGPVIVEAILTGRGNVRAAQPPSFVSPPAGEMQRIERGVTVHRTPTSATMTRRWQFQIFPSQRGTMKIPSIEIPIFSTEADERRTLQCPSTTLVVSAAERPRLAKRAPPTSPVNARATLVPLLLAGGIGATFLLLVVPWWRRRSSLEREIRGMIDDQNPAQVRENVHASLSERGIDPTSLLREGSDRGDAYRALRSLLDALERDRIELDNAAREIRRRIRELLLA